MGGCKFDKLEIMQAVKIILTDDLRLLGSMSVKFVVELAFRTADGLHKESASSFSFSIWKDNIFGSYENRRRNMTSIFADMRLPSLFPNSCKISELKTAYLFLCITEICYYVFICLVII